MNKALMCLSGLLALAMIAIIAGYEFRLRRVQDDHRLALEDLRSTYDSSIVHLGAWLAEQQAAVNCATFLTKGIPTAEKERDGYTVCNLGCVVSSVNGVEVELPFIRGYNAQLARCRKPGTSESAPSRGEEEGK